MYAIHRPSGENIPLLSVNRPLRKAIGLARFPPGRVVSLQRENHRVAGVARHRSRNTRGTSRLDAMKTEYCVFALSVRRTTSPVPSARCRNRLKTPPLRCELNAMYFPPGDHTGRASFAWSNVSFDMVSRAHSYTHTSVWPPSLMSTASRRPSGAKLGLVQSLGVAAQQLGLARSIDPPDGRARQLRVAGDIHECTAVGHGEVRRSVVGAGVHALHGWNRAPSHLERVEIEWHREHRSRPSTYRRWPLRTYRA